MTFPLGHVRAWVARINVITSAVLVAVGCFAPLCQLANAQAPAQALAPAPAPATSAVGAPRWTALSPMQQRSLQPLASSWETLSEGHRRKWIALAQNYPTLTAPEQEKLHARMVEWAALKPKEREQARLNFAQTKQLAPGERAANWDAYQALSAEEREKLASGAQRKPVGAAVAVKPVAPERLTVVPITPKTPETKQVMVIKPQSLDQNTLLPKP
jgi:Protein of unknown function (DUF3106)